MPGPSGFSLLLILISSMPGGGARTRAAASGLAGGTAPPAGAPATSLGSPGGPRPGGATCLRGALRLRHHFFMSASGDQRRQTGRPTIRADETEEPAA